jgi:hypothetical protein
MCTSMARSRLNCAGTYLAAVHEHGVRHVELAVDVQAPARRGVPVEAVVDSMCAGLDRWRPQGMSGGFIATLERNDPRGAQSALAGLRSRRSQVLGLGLAGAKTDLQAPRGNHTPQWLSNGRR